MDWGRPNKRERSLQLAGALGYVALCGYDRLQLGFLADRTVGVAGPFWGQHQRAALFASLAAAPIAANTDIVAGVASYVDRLRQPGLLILISDLLSSTAEAGLRRLATARHEVVVIHLLSPQELEPEPAEDVQLVDRETGQAMDMSLDLGTVARYRQRLAEWTNRLAKLCHERSARYVRLSSGDDVERSALHALRRQGIVA